MKLLNAAACCAAVAGGNVKRTTVMGDAARDRLSDAGSIPARSIVKTPYLRRFFFFVLHFVLHSCEMRINFICKFLLLIVDHISVYSL